MHIGFVNFTPLEYTIKTPLFSPLGGSESALCYLSKSLADLGNKVTLFGQVKEPKLIEGVLHLPIDNVYSEGELADLDFLIIQNTAKYALSLKKILPPKTKLVFWSQHDFNQPDVLLLKDRKSQDLFDAFVFVSFWQMNNYILNFGLESKKCFVLKNAISPAFNNIFNEEVFKRRKGKPPILVYTSTPFRGFNVLLDVFPEIKRQVPDVKLWIFSSMKVYQADDKPFENLYQKAKSMEGVSYFGSVSQTELSKKLVQASIFAYPNTFPETSCISAMEAMASGLSIITSNLGALPETTAGFADLVDIGKGESNYKRIFVKRVVGNVKKSFSDETFLRLKRQADFANIFYNWKLRAWEWEMFLASFN